MALFEGSLRLLHPVMPFITDEIWHAIYDGKPPQQVAGAGGVSAGAETGVDVDAEHEMAILQDFIVIVRNLRAELKD